MIRELRCAIARDRIAEHRSATGTPAPGPAPGRPLPPIPGIGRTPPPAPPTDDPGASAFHGARQLQEQLRRRGTGRRR